MLPSGGGGGGWATANLLSRAGGKSILAGSRPRCTHRGPKTRCSQVQQVPETNHKPWHSVRAHAPSGAGNKAICRLQQGDSK